MDFSFTDEQRMLRDSVRKFVRENYDFGTRREILSSVNGFSQEYWKLFAELGWLMVPFCEEDGGLGGSVVDLMVIMEELGKGLVVEPYVPTAVMAGGLVSALGSADQKQELLPALMGGICNWPVPSANRRVVTISPMWLLVLLPTVAESLSTGKNWRY